MKNRFEGNIKCKDCGETWSVCKCENGFNLSNILEKIKYIYEMETSGYTREIENAIKGFIKRDRNLIWDYRNRKISFNELMEKRNKLTGDKLA